MTANDFLSYCEASPYIFVMRVEGGDDRMFIVRNVLTNEKVKIRESEVACLDEYSLTDMLYPASWLTSPKVKRFIPTRPVEVSPELLMEY